MIRVPRLVSTIALSAALSIAAAACHKKVPAPAPTQPAPTPTAPVTPPRPPAPPAVAPPPTVPALTEAEVFARKSLAELIAEKPLDDVFFDLNEASFRADAKPILQKDADWLKKWTSVMITLEGHCDSRGSAEYNLGLGNRRANAVKDYLTSLGVPASRVTVVSKGEEQPFCNEENEGCWQQNRRGHFVITAK
jgi:peptidoglycan-associated lipoprotein